MSETPNWPESPIPAYLYPRYRTVVDALLLENPVFMYHRVGDRIVRNPEYDACDFAEMFIDLQPYQKGLVKGLLKRDKRALTPEPSNSKPEA
jgi:hypothetical protein